MGLSETLSTIEKKYPWGQISAVIAIIALVSTVYVAFLYDPGPDLKFEILANTNVYDVRVDIGNLDILFDGVNIKEKNQILSVITLKVVNDGQRDILKNSYDENSPLGFSLGNGEIVWVSDSVIASNTYLNDNVQIKQNSTKKVTFSNVILEKGEFFTLAILVLHHKDDTLNISPTGKVAGVKEIKVVETYKTLNEKPVLSEVFGGSILVQIVRFFAYSFVFLVCLIGISYLIIRITEFRDKRKRRKLVEIFKETTTTDINQKANLLLNLYIENDKHYNWNIDYLISRKYPLLLEDDYKEFKNKGE
ncbi:hypothetical protein BEH94_10680, partial [Candidatus Altiarchaeales archaeon WOR_SM1_SCG]